MAGQAASKGLLNLSYFAGLLPFPALDGGHLVMLLIETIKRKPLSPKAYQLATLIGLVAFLFLTVVVTYKDIVRLIA